MKSYHKLVFAESIEDTAPIITDPQWDDLLASTEVIVLVAVVTQATGTNPTLTIRSQVSADERTWWYNQANPEINAVVVDTTKQTTALGFSVITDPVPGFRRLEITLGGTSPRAFLKIYVTGRGENTILRGSDGSETRSARELTTSLRRG